MGKKTIIKNYILNMTFQVVVMLVSLITPPYLARTIGAESIGIYGYTLSILTYFTLFATLGINLYGQREVAYVQNDIKKRSKVFWELMLIRLVTTIIAVLFFYIFFVRRGQYSYYYTFLIFALISSLFETTWFFRGLENFLSVVLRSIGIRVSQVICVFIFVKSPDDLWIYFLLYMLGEIFGNFAICLSLRNKICKVKFKDLEIKKHIKPILILFIPQIAIQIYTVLDKTMIGSILNDMNEVAYYEQSQKIVRLAITIITSFNAVMLPRMSNIFASNNKQRIDATLYKAFSFVSFFAFPLMFGLVLISNNFVPWYYGDGFEKVKTLLIVFAPIFISIGFNDLIGVQYLVATKKQKEYTITVIIGATLNLILNFILIPNLKSIGAAIASLIAETIVLISQYLFIRKEIRLRSIIASNYKFFFAGLIMFCLVGLLNYTNMSGIIYTVIQIVFGTVVYVLTLILFKEENLMEIIEKLKNKFLKRKKNSN